MPFAVASPTSVSISPKRAGLPWPPIQWHHLLAATEMAPTLSSIKTTAAVPVQNVPVQKELIAWPLVLLLAINS